MASSDDLSQLVSRARESDAQAFTSLVALVDERLLAGSAAVVGSSIQLQAAVRCAVVAMRQDLSASPVTSAGFLSWVDSVLLTQLNELVSRASRPGTPGEDDLSRLLAHVGLMAIRQDGQGALRLAEAVRQRLDVLPAVDRALLEARYQPQRSVTELARDAGHDPAVIAQALCRIRAHLHPEASGAPTNPLAMEIAIAAQPDAAERTTLMKAITDDATLAMQVVCQARIHLLLQALLLPTDPERTRRLAAAIGVTPKTAYPDLMAPRAHHQLDRQITFGDVQHAGARSGSSGRVPITRQQSNRARTNSYRKQGQVSPGLIVACVLTVSLIAALVVWAFSGGQPRRQVAPPIESPAEMEAPQPVVPPAPSKPKIQVPPSSPVVPPAAPLHKVQVQPPPSSPAKVVVDPGAGLLQEWWEFSSNQISSLKDVRKDPRFPDKPDRESLVTTLQNPDCIKGSYHARRITGFLSPPMDGLYQFGMCVNDGAEMSLSTDESPTNLRLIVDLKKYTPDNIWDRFPAQKSQPIELKAGQRYYFRIDHYQDGSREILHVGWTRPDGVVERPIPIRHFTPARQPKR